MKRHPFSILLERKFLEWQIENGERISQAEFARILGVSRASLTMWLNGTHLPDRENAGKLAAILGQDIYDALDLPRPNPYLQKIKDLWERIPPEIQQKMAEDAERYEVKDHEKHTEGNRTIQSADIQPAGPRARGSRSALPPGRDGRLS